MKFVVVSAFIVLAISCTSSIASPQRGWAWDDVNRPPQSTAAPVPPSTPSSADCLRNCLTTEEYNPVCGTDGVTYDNSNKFNCARRCGANINISFRGACSAGK